MLFTCRRHVIYLQCAKGFICSVRKFLFALCECFYLQCAKFLLVVCNRFYLQCAKDFICHVHLLFAIPDYSYILRDIMIACKFI